MKKSSKEMVSNKAAARMRAVEEIAKAPLKKRLEVLQRAGVVDEKGHLTSRFKRSRTSHTA